MFHPNGLTPKELVFLAELMDQGSDSIARQVCEDTSDLAYDLFDPDEKDHLERAYRDWNGEPCAPPRRGRTQHKNAAVARIWPDCASA